MAAKKKCKSSGERDAQKMRSVRNKQRRIARQYKGQGTISEPHKRHLLSNRMRRLTRKSRFQGFSSQQSKRLEELKRLLKD